MFSQSPCPESVYPSSSSFGIVLMQVLLSPQDLMLSLSSVLGLSMGLGLCPWSQQFLVADVDDDDILSGQCSIPVRYPGIGLVYGPTFAVS